MSEIELPAAVRDGRASSILVDGRWRAAASGRTLPVYSPSTGERIAEIAAGDAADVDAAVRAARAAFEGPWSRFTPLQRQDLLLRFADAVERHYAELTHLDAVDMGRPVGAGPAPAEGAAMLRYYAGWPTKIVGTTIPNSAADRLSYTLKEPVGVVGSITPWNGPIIGTLKKLGPALATGCTLVLKPSEEASLTAVRLVELLHEADIPTGVVNLVTGSGVEAGAALAGHEGLDKVSFTGSTVTGRAVARAAAGNLKRVSLELGGKSPNIIFADSDLDAAVAGAAVGVFANAGQVCCAGSRIFVERPVYDDVVAALARAADGLVVGDSLDPATQIGPLVSRRQLDRVRGYVESGRDDGACLAAGTLPVDESGYFIRPTVFSEVSDEMTIAQEEIFGPVAAVLPFDTEEEAVRRANATPFGLAAGVWSRDGARAHRLARRVRAGTVWLNTYLDLDVAVPFGGCKLSGWGRDNGSESLDEYLSVKAVWASLA